MNGFSGRDVLLLASQGVLPEDISNGWRKKNGRYIINQAVDVDELGRFTTALGFCAVILGLGSILLGRVVHMVAAIPDFGIPGLLLISIGSIALTLGYVFEWRFQRGAGRSLMRLFSYYGMNAHRLALLSHEERVSLAATRLQTQADALKAAEDLSRLTPDDEHRTRIAAIQRNELKSMFNLYASFDLADSSKGWNPFLNPDTSEQSEKSAEVEADAAQTASA